MSLLQEPVREVKLARRFYARGDHVATLDVDPKAKGFRADVDTSAWTVGTNARIRLYLVNGPRRELFREVTLTKAANQDTATIWGTWPGVTNAVTKQRLSFRPATIEAVVWFGRRVSSEVTLTTWVNKEESETPEPPDEG